MVRETLTSRQNPKIKLARALHSRKGREESGLFLVEGIWHVGEAVEAAYPLEFILCAPELLRSAFGEQTLVRAAGNGIPIYETAPEIFQSLAAKQAPQGMIAVARQRSVPLVALTAQTHPWLVALVAPQDPGNVGAILRSIDAVGASGLILLDGGVDPWHPTAVRASMGALFWAPVAQAGWEAFVGWARQYRLYGSSARGVVDYREAEYAQPCILLLGSEREGLSAEQAGACQMVVRLPMGGHVSSLNLAVAAGVLLFEMRKAFQP